MNIFFCIMYLAVSIFEVVYSSQGNTPLSAQKCVHEAVQAFSFPHPVTFSESTDNKNHTVHVNFDVPHIEFDMPQLERLELTQESLDFVAAHEISHLCDYNKKPFYSSFIHVSAALANSLWSKYLNVFYGFIAGKILLKGHDYSSFNSSALSKRMHMFLNGTISTMFAMGAACAWACSRARKGEFSADREAVYALSKNKPDIRDSGISPSVCKNAINALKKFINPDEKISFLEKVFSVHPPITNRIRQIEHLEAMGQS